MAFETAKQSQRKRVEISKDEFDKLISDNPHWVLRGAIYVQPMKLKGLVWNKPMAYTLENKYYRLEGEL